MDGGPAGHPHPTGPTTGPASGDMSPLPPQFRSHENDAEAAGSSTSAASPDITGIMKPPVPHGPDHQGTAPHGGEGQDPGAENQERASDPFAGFPGVYPPASQQRTGQEAGTAESHATAGPDGGALGAVQGNKGTGKPGGEERKPSAPRTPEPPARRGRSKLMLLGVAAGGVLAVAYGAGLLLDHSDVPNGTTVLGVEIGGSTQEEAVEKLEAAVGDRSTAPLKLKVDGEETTLKPSVAGLSLDTEATVRDVTGRDYNPISVIGSLVGGSREAQPAFVVDDEKLKSALQELSSESSADGHVKFENGQAVPVPGKTALAVDTDKGGKVLADAYKQRAASGDDTVITVPVSKQEPKVTDAEMQRAIKQYGDPAMSGWVWLRAGDVEVPFSEKSIGEFFQLKAKPGGSKLQPVVDHKALAAKYGGAFDGVVIDAGAGTVKMTPAHAGAAVSKALGEPAPSGEAKRVAEVEGARSAG